MHRTLGLQTLTSIGIGGIIGTGTEATDTGKAYIQIQTFRFFDQINAHGVNKPQPAYQEIAYLVQASSC